VSAQNGSRFSEENPAPTQRDKIPVRLDIESDQDLERFQTKEMPVRAGKNASKQKIRARSFCFGDSRSPPRRRPGIPGAPDPALARFFANLLADRAAREDIPCLASATFRNLIRVCI
jgi:hypothetical protein